MVWGQWKGRTGEAINPISMATLSKGVDRESGVQYRAAFFRRASRFRLGDKIFLHMC